jgi:hypothetical protein
MWGAGGDQLAAEGGGWRLGGGQALNWISVLGELSVGESIDSIRLGIHGCTDGLCWW